MASFSLWWLPPLLLFLPLYLLFRTKGRREATASKNFPPSPPRLPIIGNLHQLGSRPHRALQKLSRKFGPIVYLQLGRVPTVVVSSVQLAREVLKTNDVHCCSRPPSPGPKLLTYNFLDVAFCPYSDYWRQMRKLFVLELLSAKRVQSFAYARSAEVDRLIRSLADAPPNTPVNLNESLYRLADGVIGTVAFGKIYGSAQFKTRKFQKVMDETLEVLGSFTAEDFFPDSAFGRWADKMITGATARRESIFREIDGFFQTVLDGHLDPGRPEPEQEDLVDALVRLWKEQGEVLGLTHDHLKAILLNTFAGGIDTCAVTTVWAMSELMRNPRVMKKAQDEVRSLIKDKPRVEEDDVPKLKYLKNVVKENFRLHPPVTLLIPREAMQPCKIGGYDVLPKTRILVNVWAMGRDPAIWDEPDEFCPERFDDRDADFRGAHFELVPFGSGRRICPGLVMGVTNVELTLANLLHCFDWEMPEGVTREDLCMEEEGGLTFRRKMPLCLVPVKHV